MLEELKKRKKTAHMVVSEGLIMSGRLPDRLLLPRNLVPLKFSCAKMEIIQ
jgi:hypothetical protein